MNEEQLKVIEERQKRANMTTVFDAVSNWDNGTGNDAFFAEWAGDDITALLAEVRSLRAKLDAVPNYTYACLQAKERGEVSVWPSLEEWLDLGEPDGNSEVQP